MTAPTYTWFATGLGLHLIRQQELLPDDTRAMVLAFAPDDYDLTGWGCDRRNYRTRAGVEAAVAKRWPDAPPIPWEEFDARASA